MLPKGEQEADICRVSEREVSLQGEAGTARVLGLPVSKRTPSGPQVRKRCNVQEKAQLRSGRAEGQGEGKVRE